MGDSETVVAQASTIVGYASTGYPSSEYAEAGANTVTDAGTLVDATTGETATCPAPTDVAYAPADGSVLGDQNIHNGEPTVMQEAPSILTYETEQPNAVVDKTQAALYDSSVNGYTVTDTSAYTTNENGNASDVAGDVASLEQRFDEAPGPALSAEEERLWSIVRANSLDFNAWTALIEETEKMAEDNILRIRKVYDPFLAEFPLCYGYWKKYADHESRIGSIDKVVEVYERAVQGVTYSVDIWLHYCIFSMSTYGDPETNRRLFERGLAYVGTDYLSYPLWDKYIEYEYSQQEWCRLAVIYTRILEHPNQQLDRYFNSFKELAGSRPLSELRTVEEASSTVPDVSMGAHSEVTEGVVRPDSVEQSPKPVSAGLTDAEELQKYIAIREEMFRKAKEFDSKIIGFETAIRRPYFHVRPLFVAELENWHNYLDFIEREGDFNKVFKLYERCLIACANYPEYWIRYILYMEDTRSMEVANNALARATQVFVKRQPEIHLFAARFKEQNGDIQGARASYELVHSEISPGLLEAIIKHANMEHRLGKLEDAFMLYEQAIAIEKGKEHSQVLPMLFAQYSRFAYLASGNADKAREILFEAIEHVQLSKPLLEALIHLESILPSPKRIDHLGSLVNKFIMPDPESANSASPAEREEISCIYLEFLDLFGDAASIKKADNCHAKHFLLHKTTSELKKRHAEDYLASDKTKLAKSYPGGAPSSQSLMGAYPNAQNQWPAGYPSQPQTWPQATQPQGQPWSSSYPQQAYGSYGSYGSSYSHPQVAATSTPQASAYAAYPPTYPVQAFPQQPSYAPPTTVAAVAPAPAPTPVQQPGSVPQAYYGSYY